MRHVDQDVVLSAHCAGAGYLLRGRDAGGQGRVDERAILKSATRRITLVVTQRVSIADAGRSELPFVVTFTPD